MGEGKIVGVGPENEGDVEDAIESAKDYMDEEDPSEGSALAHICRCYTGNE